jgi:hypothetical protein
MVMFSFVFLSPFTTVHSSYFLNNICKIAVIFIFDEYFYIICQFSVSYSVRYLVLVNLFLKYSLESYL